MHKDSKGPIYMLLEEKSNREMTSMHVQEIRRVILAFAERFASRTTLVGNSTQNCCLKYTISTINKVISPKLCKNKCISNRVMQVMKRKVTACSLMLMIGKTGSRDRAVTQIIEQMRARVYRMVFSCSYSTHSNRAGTAMSSYDASFLHNRNRTSKLTSAFSQVIHQLLSKILTRQLEPSDGCIASPQPEACTSSFSPHTLTTNSPSSITSTHYISLSFIPYTIPHCLHFYTSPSSKGYICWSLQ